MVDRTEPRLLLDHLFLRTVHLAHFQSAACFVILTPEQQMDSVLTVSLQVREQESQGPQRKLSRARIGAQACPSDTGRVGISLS